MYKMSQLCSIVADLIRGINGFGVGEGGISDGWDKCLKIRNRNYFKLPFSPVNTKHCDSVRAIIIQFRVNYLQLNVKR